MEAVVTMVVGVAMIEKIRRVEVETKTGGRMGRRRHRWKRGLSRMTTASTATFQCPACLPLFGYSPRLLSHYRHPICPSEKVHDTLPAGTMQRTGEKE